VTVPERRKTASVLAFAGLVRVALKVLSHELVKVAIGSAVHAAVPPVNQANLPTDRLAAAPRRVPPYSGAAVVVSLITPLPKYAYTWAEQAGTATLRVTRRWFGLIVAWAEAYRKRPPGWEGAGAVYETREKVWLWPWQRGRAAVIVALPDAPSNVCR
jgi:hypothetical protein